MLLRQHQSIDTLTQVVTTQAKTIATLVSLVGAGAGAGAGRDAAATAAAAAAAVANGGGGDSGSGSGSTARRESSSAPPNVADAEAIAEMVAYLDDDVQSSTNLCRAGGEGGGGVLT
ncbi:unnamed protein product [Ectocarpus sp. CCAP 1310/34]|nr:unnamed protein product [Ectocarpus sp. CCAP 1310/34]